MSAAGTGTTDLVAGRDAYGRRQWDVARARFESAAQAASLGPDDLYALSNCEWWLGDVTAALDAMRSAYEAYRRAGETGAAAMVALDIGYTLMLRGDEAQSSGWLRRAARLADALPDCPEHGYLAYLDFEEALDRDDLESAGTAAERVQAIGDRHGDEALSALGVMGQGRVLVRQGRVQAGMALLDEAMLTATTDSIEPTWAGNIYCHLMSACHEISDLRRANEWTQATARWCERMPSAGPFMGICRVHRAQLLQAQGEWAAAEREVRLVHDELPHFEMATAAEAHYVLGDLRRQRGDLDGAEDSYRAARTGGRNPQPGLALLRLTQGDPEAAGASIRSALAAVAGRPMARGHLLGAAVEIALSNGDIELATAHVTELTAIAARYEPFGFTADAQHAQGLLALAQGEAAAALTPLREALQWSEEVGMRHQAARVREALAAAYAGLGDDESAALEREAAAAELARPRATTGGMPPGPAGLTPREVEALRLVAVGLSNQQIAHQMVLSVRTVERHLASVYQKIGASGRTARATAVGFAHREGMTDGTA